MNNNTDSTKGYLKPGRATLFSFYVTAPLRVYFLFPMQYEWTGAYGCLLGASVYPSKGVCD